MKKKRKLRSDKGVKRGAPQSKSALLNKESGVIVPVEEKWVDSSSVYTTNPDPNYELLSPYIARDIKALERGLDFKYEDLPSSVKFEVGG